MVPWLAAAIPAVASGVSSALGQAQTNRANLRIAREQMAFQERMSNTAYQRRIEDLKRSGVNPMLALSSGGASSPSGASATMGDAIGQGVNSAMDVLRLRSDLATAMTDRYRLSQQAQEATSRTLLNQQMYQALGQRLPGMKELDNVQNALVRQQLASAKQAYDIGRLEMPARSVTGSKVGGYLKLLFGNAGPVPTAVGAVGAAAAVKNAGRVATQVTRNYRIYQAPK